MLIRRRGRRGVVVRADEVSFEVGVPLEDVVDVVRRLWPWEVDLHMEVGEDELVFRDRIPFERVLIYLLARRGGLGAREAEMVANYMRLHEVSAVADALLYRLWLCKRSGGNCRRLVDAFAKMAALYARVVGI